jgi:hypothetical protein
MPEHHLAKHVAGFHHPSYLVGINTAFAEVVGAGCKRLALSSPLTDEQFKAVYEGTKASAEEYKTTLHVEKDLLVTLLFPADIAKGLTVILIAHDEGVIKEYKNLKALRSRHQKAGTLTREVELEIARSFGKLLSYDDASIERLTKKRT